MKVILRSLIIMAFSGSVFANEELKINTTTHEYTLQASGIVISPETISVLNPDGSVTFDDLKILIRTQGYAAGSGKTFYVGSDASEQHAIHEGICKLIKMEFHKPKNDSGFDYVEINDPSKYANFNQDGVFLGILINVNRNIISVLKTVTCMPK